MKMTMEAQGLSDLRGRFLRMILGAPRGVRRVNRQYGEVLRAALVRHASGRPGPNVVTGEYISRMNITFESDGYRIVASNNSPQAYRLEYGFVGVDEIGRHYAQPPFPHFRPAFEEVMPQYVQAMSDAIPGWMR